MNITVFDYADAVGVHLGTARRRLECVPRDVQSRPHRYGLADALLTLKKKEVDDGAMRRLFLFNRLLSRRLWCAWPAAVPASVTVLSCMTSVTF